MAPAGLTARMSRLPRYGPTAAGQCSATRAPATQGTSLGVLPSQQPTRASTRSSRKEPGAALRATRSWPGASSPRHQFAVTNRRPRPNWDGAFCCVPEQPPSRPLKPERAGTNRPCVAATLIRSLAKGILTQPSCARAASQGQARTPRLCKPWCRGDYGPAAGSPEPPAQLPLAYPARSYVQDIRRWETYSITAEGTQRSALSHSCLVKNKVILAANSK